MFDTVRNNPKLVQIFLLIIILPFALWGVDSYVRNDAGEAVVANVGDTKISQQQFQQALSEQRDSLRKRLGPQFDPAMLDAIEVRRALLDNLVNQRLLSLYAAEARLGVSNDQLAAFLTRVPELQEDGKFSVERFEQIAAAQGMTKQGLEARIRQDMVMRQATSVVAEGGMATRGQSEAWLSAALESREISQMTLRPEDFMAQASLPEDAASKFYEANPDKFQLPEQLRFEFVVLSQAALAQQATVSDAEIKAAYEAKPERYRQPEERRASHILIMADKDAKPEVMAAAEAKARDLLAQLRKAPADFAKLARQHSQDPGSAKQGGDLGVVARGVMVKPFEEAVFSLKDKETSDLVRTDYGFHIIRLDALKGGGQKPLASVKDEIAAELKTQQAAKKYAEAAESFSNTVYEQADSLAPVVEKLALKVQQGPWVARGRAPQGLNEKMMTALFSDDAIKNRRNTEAIEIAPNTLMAARVVEHKAADKVAFKDVQVEIERQLKREAAAKLAAQEAEARLARLQKGESVGQWAPSRSLTRIEASNGGALAREAVSTVFRLDATQLPAYAQLTLKDGNAVIYRVSKVVARVPGKDDAIVTGLRQQYAQMSSEADFSGWLNSLRTRYKVVTHDKYLEKDAAAAK